MQRLSFLVAVLVASAIGQTVYVEYVFAGGCTEGAEKTQDNCLDYFSGSTEVKIDTTTNPDNPAATWEFDCTINKNEKPKNVTIDIPLQIRGLVDTLYSTDQDQSGRIQHIDPAPAENVFFEGPAGVLLEGLDVIDESATSREYYNIQLKNFIYSGSSITVPCVALLFSMLAYFMF